MTSADQTASYWRRTALGRLRFELAGIAFARNVGGTPEDWARHLFSAGAAAWMGTPAPTAKEYLLHEAAAFDVLYPRVGYELGDLGDQEATLVFTRGCLGGWGKNQWRVAKSLGLGKGHVCRYCRQAFRSWSSQLGLESLPEPQPDGTCIFRVYRPG